MIRFGLIGCGNAARLHADVIRALGHEIAAVCARPNSPRLPVFARDFGVPRTFTDWRAMVESRSLDALVIAVSWDQTEHLAADVVRAGVPVLIEKPLALSSQRAEEIAESAGANAPRVMVGFNRRFYDFIPQMKQTIETAMPVAAELHCPDAFHAELAQDGDRVLAHRLVHKTSHWLDLAQYLLGRLRVVDMVRGGRGHSVYSGLLQTSQGIPVHLYVHFGAPATTALVFHFDEFICRLSPAEVYRRYEGMEVLEPTPEVPYRRYQPRIVDEQVTDARFKPGFLNQMRHFIETCVERRSVERRGCTLQEACELTRLCEVVRGEPPPDPRRHATPAESAVGTGGRL